MVNVGTLDAKLTVDTREFTAGINKAQKQAQSATSSMSKGFSGLTKSILAAGAALATLAAARTAVDFLTVGSEIAGVRAAFENFAQTSGEDVPRALDQLRDSTQGVVTDFQLMVNANRALQSGIVDTISGFSDLAAAAVVLGQGVGIDANAAVEQLTTALARNSTQVLDNFGIILTVGQAQREYAEQLGKTTAQLTAQERQQAFAIIGQQRAIALSREQAAAQLGVGRGALQFSVSLSNLRDRFAEVLSQSAPINSFFVNLSDRIGAITKQDIEEGMARLVGELRKLRDLDFKNLEPVTQLLVGAAGTGAVAITVNQTGTLIRNIGAIGQFLLGISSTVTVILGNFQRVRSLLAGGINVGVKLLTTVFFKFVTGLTDALGLMVRLSAVASGKLLFAFLELGTASTVFGTGLLGVFRGLTDSLRNVQVLQPIIDGIFNALSRISFESIFGAGIVIVDKLARALGILFNVVGLIGQGFEILVEGIFKDLTRVDVIRARLFGSQEDLAAAIARDNAQLQTLLETSSQIDATISNLENLATNPLIDAGQVVNNVKKAIREMRKESQEASEAVGDSAAAAATEAGKAVAEAQKASEKAAEAANKAAEETQAKIKEFNENPISLSITGKLDREQIRQEIQALQSELERLAPSVIIGSSTGAVDTGGSVVQDREQAQAIRDRISALQALDQAAVQSQTNQSQLAASTQNLTLVFGEAFADAENNIFRTISIFDQAGALISNTVQQIAVASGNTTIALNNAGASLNFFAQSAASASSGVAALIPALSSTDRLLVRQAQLLATLSGATKETQQQIVELARELAKGGEEASKAREKLQQLVTQMRQTGDSAREASGGLSELGQTARNEAASGMSAAADGARELRNELGAVTAQANSASGALSGVGSSGFGIGGGGGGRSSQSLGRVISGDETDPANIQRALTNITSQLTRVSGGGRDAFGFVNLQIKALAAERDRLQALLRDAQKQQQEAITASIVNTFIGQGLTGEDLTRAVQDALAVRTRFGLSSGATIRANASFSSIQTSGGNVIG